MFSGFVTIICPCDAGEVLQDLIKLALVFEALRILFLDPIAGFLLRGPICPQIQNRSSQSFVQEVTEQVTPRSMMAIPTLGIEAAAS